VFNRSNFRLRIFQYFVIENYSFNFAPSNETETGSAEEQPVRDSLTTG
jgi:hypothetical protein